MLPFFEVHPTCCPLPTVHLSLARKMTNDIRQMQFLSQLGSYFSCSFYILISGSDWALSDFVISLPSLLFRKKTPASGPQLFDLSLHSNGGKSARPTDDPLPRLKQAILVFSSHTKYPGPNVSSFQQGSALHYYTTTSPNFPPQQNQIVISL
jgi:hypothetical protein